MAKDYYKILGLERGASADEIKRAYRKLSKELHPDKHKGDKEIEKRYKEVNEAYEVLRNPKKKQAYDQFGSAEGFAGGAGGFGGFDFSGFQQGDAGGFADIFESFFGGGAAGGRRQQRAQGESIEVELPIDLMDAVKGFERDVQIQKFVQCDQCQGSGTEADSKLVTCSDCQGTGQVTRTQQSFFGTIQQSFVCPACQGAGKIPEKPCRKCSGEGRVQQRATVHIEVPAGVHDGQALRLREQGHAGRQGQPAGDLLVHIAVRPDARFGRNGDDIHSTVDVPVVDAILGAKIPVETVHGKVTLTVPEGTQPGQVLRIKGKGMPVVNSSRTGDHYVTVNVEIPKKLSRKERKILEEWKNA